MERGEGWGMTNRAFDELEFWTAPLIVRHAVLARTNDDTNRSIDAMSAAQHAKYALPVYVYGLWNVSRPAPMPHHTIMNPEYSCSSEAWPKSGSLTLNEVYTGARNLAMKRRARVKPSETVPRATA